jgi:methylated-DNA-[protein]-cysteine S-methyltransferase
MIAIPCHRVIGKDGKLKGFSGGLEVKDFLLSHEMLFIK